MACNTVYSVVATFSITMNYSDNSTKAIDLTESVETDTEYSGFDRCPRCLPTVFRNYVCSKPTVVSFPGLRNTDVARTGSQKPLRKRRPVEVVVDESSERFDDR